MPKVISYTPSWLSRPSPGFRLFAPSNATSTPTRPSEKASEQLRHGDDGKDDYLGPKRAIARRGTEIFVVVDNQIRWSDLCMLKDDWSGGQDHVKVREKPKANTKSNAFLEIAEEEAPLGAYRTLKVPVSEQIRQLIPSPNGKLLAILTSHTVHIAILPESSHLGHRISDPIRLKTHTLGPTTHVLSQSPVASALWHPLGVSGNCLITITADAAVRIWELQQENRWSFDSPALAIDLKKLVNGTSAEEDFSAHSIGRSRGFSVDALDMEVAAASFGGTGVSGESAWSSMTLWIAMKEGDVYALCPLLPSKWQPSRTLIPSLSTCAVLRSTPLQDDSPSAEEKQFYAQQYQWISDIDEQEPVLVSAESEFAFPVETYNRPSHPGRRIPRLQGPFQVLPDDPEEDLELSDIYVIAAKVDTDELMNGEEIDFELDEADQAGLSISVVCLVTRNGKIYICLDLDGVEGQWLPSKEVARKQSTLELTPSCLVVLEVLDTLYQNDIHNLEWPTLTPDVNSRYSFFITHSKGVYFFSLNPWLPSLESESQNSSRVGAEFRIDVLMKGSGTLRERLLHFTGEEGSCAAKSLTSCVVLQDSDIGYFLLTAVGEQPEAATLDMPNTELNSVMSSEYDRDFESELKAITSGPTRSVYQPPASLWVKSSLPNFLEKHVQSRHKKMTKDEIRLSGATLDLMTEAHRVLSQETHQLGIAAADLFRRCERLQDELRDQIRRANDVANRIEQVTDQDMDYYEDEAKLAGVEALERRFQTAQSRQEELVDRHDALRRKIGSIGSGALSEKERKLAEEINQMEHSILALRDDRDADGEQAALEPWQRYEEARKLASELLSHAKDLTGSSQPNGHDAFKIPPDLRKAKVAQVMGMLERESALVDATQHRLERLNLSSFG